MKAVDPVAQRRNRRAGSARHAWFFVLKFLACWLAFTSIVGFFPQIETVTVKATIATLRALLAILPGRSGANGADNLFAGPVSFQIVTECTSLMPTLILWSAILAFPAPWRLRVRGLAIGAAGLWIYNLVRILGLIPVMAYWPSVFEVVHVYLWQTTTLVVVMGFFFLWLRSMTPPIARARA